jgi:hypothetical protein
MDGAKNCAVGPGGASENGRLRPGDQGRGPGDRRQMASLSASSSLPTAPDADA